MKSTLQKDFNMALEKVGEEKLRRDLEIQAVRHFIFALERYLRLSPADTVEEVKRDIINRELLYYPPRPEQDLAELHAQVLKSGIFAWYGEAKEENLSFVGPLSIEDLYRTARTLLPEKYMMADHKNWAYGREPLSTIFLR